ncbi:AAA family ATPase [Lonepinella sp. BR2271]|uniref:AAA family ATPase n=1 Tax=Lonepinella sp. BR2271 TaxID=3434550 RepID=UPI003F6DD892
MLVNFTLDNFSSFRDTHNLSLEISTLQKDDILQENIIKINEKKSLLKSVLIYGANASGKSNLLNGIIRLKIIVLLSYRELERNLLEQLVMPFALDEKTQNEPTVFEITFIEKNIKYRYGIAISNGEIIEEWLYLAKHREVMLFSRDKQNIEYNKTSFTEASLFVKENKLDKTASHIPFISVLAAFQGKHSLNAIRFFNKLNIISGVYDISLGDFTFNMMNESPEFKQWSLNILKNFNIADVMVREENSDAIELSRTQDTSTLHIPQNKISVIKQLTHSEHEIEWPLSQESDGTKKIIHLLGPIYDTLVNDKILLIDEFDSKFHTLLSKHLFSIFHKHSKQSQLIVSVQDTNLMDTNHFRRDQIWFVHKDSIEQDSRLYSLSDYKIQIKKSYSQDYLNGAFDAIPLFDSFETVQHLME